MIRGALRALPVVIGWLIIAVAVDIGLGAALDLARPNATIAGPPTAPATVPAANEAATGTCLGESPMSADLRQRAESPAYDTSPWILEYWCEFGRLSNDYVPYLYARQRDTYQRLITTVNGVRRSYQPDGIPRSAPVIWFFGGSTMWGWGQRDLHTIPSEVARLSEQAGTPVRVVNLGQLAWVHWQEALAFERELASRPAPDLVVFYDGVNEINVQADALSPYGGRPSDQPTIYDFDTDPPTSLPGAFSAPPRQDRSTWLDRWTETSAVAQLARGLGDVLGAEPAGAVESPTPLPTETIVERTVDVYERGRAVSIALARRHDVPPVFFWQPRRPEVGNGPIDRAVRARLTPPTVDLGGTLDGMDPGSIYSDDAHTNERGARLVAEAMWAQLLPAVQAVSEPTGEVAP